MWTILILVLVAIAIACWIGSFAVFGQPEKPLSYAILTKLNKLDPPKRFELTSAPRGQFLRPAQILERYSRLTPRELERANGALMRNYLRNYKLTQDLVPYVVGSYNILDSYELTPTDFFLSGVVALAQAKDVPQILLEQVFTAEARSVPALKSTLVTGVDLDLRRENELSALVNVSRMEDGRLKATAISILYPSYDSATGSGTFTLEPPAKLNVAAGLPVVTLGRQSDAEKKLAAYRQKAGLATNPSEQSKLMRVERPVAVNLATQPTIPTATPIPIATPIPMATPIPASEIPVTIVADSSVAPETIAPPQASPTPAPVVAAATAGAWQTYDPGQMPRGRLMSVRDMPDVAQAGVGADRVYLQGNFVVTASGQNRAVLRTQGAIAESIGIGRTSTVRVIVEFPSGARPPDEGTTFSRDARRPFQVTEVKEGADGQVNVYVREITRP